MDDPLFRLQTLYRQHTYQPLLNECEGYDSTDPIYHPVQLLKLKTLLVLGLTQQAFQHSENLLATEITDEKWLTYFQLWHQFLAVYQNQSADLQPTILYFKQRASDLVTDPYATGLAYDLIGRTLSVGMAVQLLSPVVYKTQAEFYWKKSADCYSACQAHDDYIGVLKRLAQLQERSPLAEPLQALATYHQLLNADPNDLFAFTRAETGITLAEADFVLLHTSQQAGDRDALKRILAEFDKVEAEFQTAGYDWGYAWVADRLGSLLLRYGYADGEPIIKESIERYHQADAVVDQQSALRTLAHWYQLRGDETLFRQTEQAANALNDRIEFNLSQHVEQLNLVNIAYREGNYGQVLQGCDKALNDSTVGWVRSQFLFLKANTLGTLGRKDKTETAGQVVRSLQAAGPTSLLSDALVLWSRFLFDQGDLTAYEQAIKAMQQAIDIDAQLGDKRSQAGRYTAFGQFLLDWERTHRGRAVITNLLEACWENAFKLLAEDYTYEGFLQLCALVQIKGQQLFIAGHLEKAREQFAEAERLMLLAEAQGQLLFLYSQQGFFEIQTARHERSQERYLAALQKFDQAMALVSTMDLGDAHWRVVFQRGICFRELGQLETESVQQEYWWAQAESAYQTTHQLIISLMLTADYQTGDSQHMSRAGFLGERQTVYQQGFYLNLLQRNRPLQALQWLDRMKSQALLAAVRRQRVLPLADIPGLGMHDLDLVELYRQLTDLEQTSQRRVVVFVYYFIEDYQFVFCLSTHNPTLHFQQLSIPVEALRRLKDMVFQKPGGVRRMVVDETEQNWLGMSGLIRPVEEETQPGDIVVLIPHGMLHDMPLHTLHTTTNQSLIERNPVGYHLSLALFQESLVRPGVTAITKAQVFGDSRHNLTGSAREARQIAQRLGAELHVGNEATRSQFLKAFTQSELIHFAGHGEFNRQEGMDQCLLMAAGEQISARDLIGLVSPADLIVLSGCETGLSEYRAGDEPFSLLRALLSAGAATTVVSQWRINDQATEKFFDYFYEQLLTGQPGRKVLALQRAAVQMISQGYSFYEWGSFILTGSL